MSKPKSSVEEFADTIRDNPQEIIEWAEREIAEYKKLIRILKRRISQPRVSVTCDCGWKGRRVCECGDCHEYDQCTADRQCGFGRCPKCGAYVRRSIWKQPQDRAGAEPGENR